MTVTRTNGLRELEESQNLKTKNRNGNVNQKEKNIST